MDPASCTVSVALFGGPARQSSRARKPVIYNPDLVADSASGEEGGEEVGGGGAKKKRRRTAAGKVDSDDDR